MAEVFRTERRVEFCHTDVAGIAHFSVFFQFMEQAEHAFLRSVGLSVLMQLDGGTMSWPRVSASCDYKGPVHFEDVIEIELSIGRVGERSITYEAHFAVQEQLVAQGSLTAVCCRIQTGERPVSMPIPERVLAAIGPYLP